MAYTREQIEAATNLLAAGLSEKIATYSSFLNYCVRQHDPTVHAASSNFRWGHPAHSDANSMLEVQAGDLTLFSSFYFDVGKLLASPALVALKQKTIASICAAAIEADLAKQYNSFSIFMPMGTPGQALTDRQIAKAASVLDTCNLARAFPSKCLVVASDQIYTAADCQNTGFDPLQQLSLWDAMKTGDATAQVYATAGLPRYRGFRVVGCPSIQRTGTSPVCTHNFAFLEHYGLVYVTCRREAVCDATYYRVYAEGPDTELGIMIECMISGLNSGEQCWRFYSRGGGIGWPTGGIQISS